MVEAAEINYIFESLLLLNRDALMLPVFLYYTLIVNGNNPFGMVTYCAAAGSRLQFLGIGTKSTGINTRFLYNTTL